MASYSLVGALLFLMLSAPLLVTAADPDPLMDFNVNPVVMSAPGEC